jgi:hypothetical protein
MDKLPDLNWCKRTGWEHDWRGFDKELSRRPVMFGEKREQNKSRIKAEKHIEIEFYKKRGRPPLLVARGPVKRSVARTAAIEKLFRFALSLAREMADKLPRFYQAEFEGKNTSNFTAGNQELLSAAASALVRVIDRYRPLPSGEWLRSLIADCIKKRLKDSIRAEQKHHFDVHVRLCDLCGGTGFVANAKWPNTICPVCRGKKKEKSYTHVFDLIDYYAPAGKASSDDEDPPDEYPLARPSPTAEERLVAHARAAAVRRAVRTAVGQLDGHLGKEVCACVNAGVKIPVEIAERLRAMLAVTEIDVPCCSLPRQQTVEPYARSRFHDVWLIPEIRRTLQDALPSWWAEACARNLDVWVDAVWEREDIEARTARWRAFFTGEEIEAAPVPRGGAGIPRKRAAG